MNNFSESSNIFKGKRPRGKRKTKQPCLGCYLHEDRCICQWIPRLDLKTKLTLVIHVRELKRTSNTGLLAVKALHNSQMFIRGEPGNIIDFSKILDPLYEPLILYPSPVSVDLTPDFIKTCNKPIQLIVPDGNWRQASKVPSRYLELKSIQKVMIKKPNMEKFRMRSETTIEGMATLQAISHAFSIIENEIVGSQLMNLYHLKLKQTLLGRGITM